MMEQNDQYLKALDSHLEGHLSDDLRAKRIQEICTHLTMDQADRQAHGSDVDTAAREARRTLGSPEVLARQLVRQARGYDSAPAWRLSLACGIALTLSTVAMFWVNPLNQYMPVWSVNGLHWVQFMALVYFGFLVVRTQRWLVWPIAGWLVVASIGMDTFILNKLPPVMPSSPKVQAQVLATTRRLMADQKMVDDWQQGRAPVDQAPVAQAVFFSEGVPSAGSPCLFASNPKLHLEACCPCRSVTPMEGKRQGIRGVAPNKP